MKINKKIAGSFVTIAAVLTAVVGITFAQFNSQASLTDNTLSTSTPNLEISTNNLCNEFSSSSPGISSNNLVPGEFGSMGFCLENASTGDLSFDVKAVGTVTGGGLSTSLITVTVNCGLGPKTITLDGVSQSELLRTIPAGAVVNCTIRQTLSGTATDSASGKSINYNVNFIGTQS